MSAWWRLAQLGEVDRGFLALRDELWVVCRRGPYAAVAIADPRPVPASCWTSSSRSCCRPKTAGPIVTASERRPSGEAPDTSRGPRSSLHREVRSTGDREEGAEEPIASRPGPASSSGRTACRRSRPPRKPSLTLTLDLPFTFDFGIGIGTWGWIGSSTSPMPMPEPTIATSPAETGAAVTEPEVAAPRRSCRLPKGPRAPAPASARTAPTSTGWRSPASSPASSSRSPRSVSDESARLGRRPMSTSPLPSSAQRPEDEEARRDPRRRGSDHPRAARAGPPGAEPHGPAPGPHPDRPQDGPRVRPDGRPGQADRVPVRGPDGLPDRPDRGHDGSRAGGPTVPRPAHRARRGRSPPGRDGRPGQPVRPGRHPHDHRHGDRSRWWPPPRTSKARSASTAGWTSRSRTWSTEASGSADDDLEDLESAAIAVDEGPIVKMVNLLIGQAIADRASDIHIEPAERDVRIRYRIDGVLAEVMRSPKNIQAGLLSRLKVMADINIAERRIPQDGRISLTVGGKSVDLRVATLPTVFGEKIVIRILDKSSVLLQAGGAGVPGDLVRALPARLHQAVRRDPGDRADRVGEVDHPVRDAQHHQQAGQEHHHGRGPGGVPAAGHQPDADQQQGRPDLRLGAPDRSCVPTPTWCWSARSATTRPP